MYSMGTHSNIYNRANEYLVKEIMEASPQQLLIKIYDFAIANCQRHELIKTNNALQELINSLNFDHPEAKEISVGLLRLYQYCQDQMRSRNYQEVYRILTELRSSWVEAFSKN